MKIANSVVFLLPFYVVLAEDDFCLLQSRATVQRVKHCPEGWVRYEDNKCFKLVNEMKNREDAEKSCNGMGATLASVHSDVERQFLGSMFLNVIDKETPTEPWLGGRKIGNRWIWSDFSPFDYENWWPNFSRANSGCVVLPLGQNYAETHPDIWGLMAVHDCLANKYMYFCQLHQIDVRELILKESN